MTEIGIKNQPFRVEFSFTGITRETAARAIGALFGTEPEYLKGTYDTWTVQDQQDRTWRLTYDPRVCGEWKLWDTWVKRRDRAYRVRLASPVLSYDDLPRFQECIRQLRYEGAKVNGSCEMSVHVDASSHNRQSLKNLIGMMYSKEDILFRAVQTDEHRAEVYSRKVREPLIQQIRTLSCDETKDLTELEEIWYEGSVRPDQTLNKTCRYALNLHSVFFQNTIEWRCFNSTLHSGQAAAYVNLCLAMSAQAVTQRSAVMKKTVSDNEQFTFRTWLVRLGLNGEEFKQTRELLLENLDGSKAWLHPKEPVQKKQQRAEAR